MWREALHMISNGEASAEDIDFAIINGPGPRWAMMDSDYARFEFASLFTRLLSKGPRAFRRSVDFPAPAGRFENRLGAAWVWAFGGKALPCEASMTHWKKRVIDSMVVFSNSRANGITLT